jgi:hypothetical protein
MHLAPLLILIAIAALVVAIFSGGGATVMLVPVAVVAAGAAFGTRMVGRYADSKGRSGRHADTSHKAPETPDELVEARQRNQ